MLIQVNPLYIYTQTLIVAKSWHNRSAIVAQPQRNLGALAAQSQCNRSTILAIRLHSCRHHGGFVSHRSTILFMS